MQEQRQRRTSGKKRNHLKNSVFTQENYILEGNVIFLSSVINREGRQLAQGRQLPQELKNIHAACKPCSDSRGAWSRCGSPTWQHSLNIYVVGPFAGSTLPVGFLQRVNENIWTFTISLGSLSHEKQCGLKWWRRPVASYIIAALLIRTCNVFHSHLDGGQSRGFSLRWRRHRTQLGDVRVIQRCAVLCWSEKAHQQRAEHNFIANPAEWWLNIQVKRLLCVVILASFATPLGLLFYWVQKGHLSTWQEQRKG